MAGSCRKTKIRPLQPACMGFFILACMNYVSVKMPSQINFSLHLLHILKMPSLFYFKSVRIDGIGCFQLDLGVSECFQFLLNYLVVFLKFTL